MTIKYFCPYWGSEHLGWDDFLRKVKEEGFNGVELAIANNTSRDVLDRIWEKLEQHNLEVIPQHYGTYDADYSRHYDAYAGWFANVRPYKMLRIDSQTGKDFFSFDENKALVDLAMVFSKS